MVTLLTPSAGGFLIGQTSQTRLASYPQLVWTKALTASLVGDAAVKFAGSGLGNVGTAAGAGADGAGAGAAGTSCWAVAWKIGRDNATNVRALAKRIEGRIKLFLQIG